MSIEAFGDCSLGPVRRLVLGRAPGLVLEVLDLGATTHALWVTGGDGVRRNVLLGHATPGEYLESTAYLGATVGRYANRIRGGRFEVDGVAHQVGAHDRGNSLHGGPDGFDRRIWEVVSHDDDVATLELVSPDGDQGYPGAVTARVTYRVTPDEVEIELTATTTSPTPVNLTNHAYWDLFGEGSGCASDQLLSVEADQYVQADADGIPLPGPPSAVEGTPLDLRRPVRVRDAASHDHPQVRLARGIDHTFVTPHQGLRCTARLETPHLRLELHSDQPGIQVYSGNFLDGTLRGTSGRLYRQGDGVALEPQLFPDSPNRPDYPGECLLRPGAAFGSRIAWRLTPLG